MVDSYVDLEGWKLQDFPTNVCCECLRRPKETWMVSGGSNTARADTCNQCKDHNAHWRCCLCEDCARKVGVLW